MATETVPSQRRMPYDRWELFCVYGNADDRTFHIMVVDDNGGYIFADGFQSLEAAEWTCDLLNKAIGQRSPQAVL
jgi:hypothetical protein